MPPLYERLQELAEQVPTLLQPLLVAAAGMIPYVEGEGASALGILAGLNPVVAGVAAALGNFASVVLVVLIGARARAAVVRRRARDASLVAAGTGGGGDVGGGGAILSQEVREQPGKPKSKGRLRLERWLVRFGVPGASLLAPLALPTQLTAATFVASGASKRWVLLWQAVAIVLWTGAVTVAATGLVTVVDG
ncbi:MAG: small multidrug efflux protein [Phycicoccus sp.]